MRTATLAARLRFVVGRRVGTGRARRQRGRSGRFGAPVLRAEPAAVRGRRHVRQRLRRELGAVLGRGRPGRVLEGRASTLRQACRGSAREDSQLVGERVFVSSGTVSSSSGFRCVRRSSPGKWPEGYRFHFSPRIIPYAGAGSDVVPLHRRIRFRRAGGEARYRRHGRRVQSGVEVRAHRWVGIAAGAERTRVTGILGNGGLSQLYTSGELQEGRDGEDDLGGWAFQFRVDRSVSNGDHASERASEPRERAGEPRRACGGVRGAKPLG